MPQRALPVLLLLIAFAVGCGGSDDGATASTIPRAVFIRKANAVCAEAYDRVRAGYRSFVREAGDGAFSTQANISRYADTVLIPAKRRELEKLRALGSPSDDEDEVGEILEAYEEGIGKAEKDPRAAVTSTYGVFVKATKLAERYGLEDCRY